MNIQFDSAFKLYNLHSKNDELNLPDLGKLQKGVKFIVFARKQYISEYVNEAREISKEISLISNYLENNREKYEEEKKILLQEDIEKLEIKINNTKNMKDYKDKYDEFIKIFDEYEIQYKIAESWCSQHKYLITFENPEITVVNCDMYHNCNDGDEYYERTTEEDKEYGILYYKINIIQSYITNEIFTKKQKSEFMIEYEKQDNLYREKQGELYRYENNSGYFPDYFPYYLDFIDYNDDDLNCKIIDTFDYSPEDEMKEITIKKSFIHYIEFNNEKHNFVEYERFCYTDILDPTFIRKSNKLKTNFKEIENKIRNMLDKNWIVNVISNNKKSLINEIEVEIIKKFDNYVFGRVNDIFEFNKKTPKFAKISLNCIYSVPYKLQNDINRKIMRDLYDDDE
jgi:hypothetical protein